MLTAPDGAPSSSSDCNIISSLTAGGPSAAWSLMDGWTNSPAANEAADSAKMKTVYATLFMFCFIRAHFYLRYWIIGLFCLTSGHISRINLHFSEVYLCTLIKMELFGIATLRAGCVKCSISTKQLCLIRSQEFEDRLMGAFYVQECFCSLLTGVERAA
jgi:hypothetical protein